MVDSFIENVQTRGLDKALAICCSRASDEEKGSDSMVEYTEADGCGLNMVEGSGPNMTEDSELDVPKDILVETLAIRNNVPDNVSGNAPSGSNSRRNPAPVSPSSSPVRDRKTDRTSFDRTLHLIPEGWEGRSKSSADNLSGSKGSDDVRRDIPLSSVLSPNTVRSKGMPLKKRDSGIPRDTASVTRAPIQVRGVKSTSPGNPGLNSTSMSFDPFIANQSILPSGVPTQIEVATLAHLSQELQAVNAHKEQTIQHLTNYLTKVTEALQAAENAKAAESLESRIGIASNRNSSTRMNGNSPHVGTIRRGSQRVSPVFVGGIVKIVGPISPRAPGISPKNSVGSPTSECNTAKFMFGNATQPSRLTSPRSPENKRYLKKEGVKPLDYSPQLNAYIGTSLVEEYEHGATSVPDVQSSVLEQASSTGAYELSVGQRYQSSAGQQESSVRSPIGKSSRSDSPQQQQKQQEDLLKVSYGRILMTQKVESASSPATTKSPKLARKEDQTVKAEQQVLSAREFGSPTRGRLDTVVMTKNSYAGQPLANFRGNRRVDAYVDAIQEMEGLSPAHIRKLGKLQSQFLQDTIGVQQEAIGVQQDNRTVQNPVAVVSQNRMETPGIIAAGAPSVNNVNAKNDEEPPVLACWPFFDGTGDITDVSVEGVSLGRGHELLASTTMNSTTNAEQTHSNTGHSNVEPQCFQTRAVQFETGYNATTSSGSGLDPPHRLVLQSPSRLVFRQVGLPPLTISPLPSTSVDQPFSPAKNNPKPWEMLSEVQREYDEGIRSMHELLLEQNQRLLAEHLEPEEIANVSSVVDGGQKAHMIALNRPGLSIAERVALLKDLTKQHHPGNAVASNGSCNDIVMKAAVSSGECTKSDDAPSIDAKSLQLNLDCLKIISSATHLWEEREASIAHTVDALLQERVFDRLSTLWKRVVYPKKQHVFDDLVDETGNHRNLMSDTASSSSCADSEISVRQKPVLAHLCRKEDVQGMNLYDVVKEYILRNDGSSPPGKVSPASRRLLSSLKSVPSSQHVEPNSVLDMCLRQSRLAGSSIGDVKNLVREGIDSLKDGILEVVEDILLDQNKNLLKRAIDEKMSGRMFHTMVESVGASPHFNLYHETILTYEQEVAINSVNEEKKVRQLLFIPTSGGKGSGTAQNCPPEGLRLLEGEILRLQLKENERYLDEIRLIREDLPEVFSEAIHDGQIAAMSEILTQEAQALEELMDSLREQNEILTRKQKSYGLRATREASYFDKDSDTSLDKNFQAMRLNSNLMEKVRRISQFEESVAKELGNAIKQEVVWRSEEDRMDRTSPTRRNFSGNSNGLENSSLHDMIAQHPNRKLYQKCISDLSAITWPNATRPVISGSALSSDRITSNAIKEQYMTTSVLANTARGRSLISRPMSIRRKANVSEKVKDIFQEKANHPDVASDADSAASSANDAEQRDKGSPKNLVTEKYVLNGDETSRMKKEKKSKKEKKNYVLDASTGNRSAPKSMGNADQCVSGDLPDFPDANPLSDCALSTGNNAKGDSNRQRSPQFESSFSKGGESSQGDRSNWDDRIIQGDGSNLSGNPGVDLLSGSAIDLLTATSKGISNTPIVSGEGVVEAPSTRGGDGGAGGSDSVSNTPPARPTEIVELLRGERLLQKVRIELNEADEKLSGSETLYLEHVLENTSKRIQNRINQIYAAGKGDSSSSLSPTHFTDQEVHLNKAGRTNASLAKNSDHSAAGMLQTMFRAAVEEADERAANGYHTRIEYDAAVMKVMDSTHARNLGKTVYEGTAAKVDSSSDIISKALAHLNLEFSKIDDEAQDANHAEKRLYLGSGPADVKNRNELLKVIMELEKRQKTQGHDGLEDADLERIPSVENLISRCSIEGHELKTIANITKQLRVGIESCENELSNIQNTKEIKEKAERMQRKLLSNDAWEHWKIMMSGENKKVRQSLAIQREVALEEKYVLEKELDKLLRKVTVLLDDEWGQKTTGAKNHVRNEKKEDGNDENIDANAKNQNETTKSEIPNANEPSGENKASSRPKAVSPKSSGSFGTVGIIGRDVSPVSQRSPRVSFSQAPGDISKIQALTRIDVVSKSTPSGNKSPPLTATPLLCQQRRIMPLFTSPNAQTAPAGTVSTIGCYPLNSFQLQTDPDNGRSQPCRNSPSAHSPIVQLRENSAASVVTNFTTLSMPQVRTGNAGPLFSPRQAGVAVSPSICTKEKQLDENAFRQNR